MKLLVIFCTFIVVQGISKEDLCSLDPDEGGCESFTGMYFYNRFTGQCHEFVFRGCLGNKNQFETKEECESYCEGMALDKKPDCNKKADKGPCDGWMIRYYYDTEEKNCKYFEYGGCRGNANNFANFDECMDMCYTPPESKK